MSALEPVIIELEGRLENPGDSLPVSGRIEVDELDIRDNRFSLEGGIAFDVVCTIAGVGILVTGIVRTRVIGACDRCLEPASHDVSGEIDEYYLFEAPEDAEEYEDGYELVGEDRKVDLSGAINDAVVMDVPYVLLCDPDCRGLCPTCGANLNEGDCGCAEAAERDWVDSDENPFAALKDLKLD